MKSNVKAMLAIMAALAKIGFFFVSPTAYLTAEYLRLVLAVMPEPGKIPTKRLTHMKSFAELKLQEMAEQYKKLRDGVETETEMPKWAKNPYRVLTLTGLYWQAAIYICFIMLVAIVEVNNRYAKVFSFFQKTTPASTTPSAPPAN